jgi:hypothetical protein
MTTLTKAQVLAKLRRFARKWGGDLVKITKDEYAAKEEDSFCSAPFTSWDAGCDYQTKVVYFSDWCEPEDLEDFAITLIHELGHVLASRFQANSDDMYKHDEEWRFFGWELCLALKIGLTRKQFYQGHKDYVVEGESGEDIAYLLRSGTEGRRKLKKLLDGRVQTAKDLGLIKKDQPISIRTLIPSPVEA